MNNELKTTDIQNRIFTIRGMQLMIDKDLAELYQVETRVLNQAVKRNIERFPKDFMFQLTKEEANNFIKTQTITSTIEQTNLKSQIVISREHGGSRKLPYAFTEQGVSMLSAVLRSKVAVEVSINIIRAFVEMKKFINTNAVIFQRLDSLEQKQIKTDTNFEKVFKALEDKSVKQKQGIFYNGQVFDAYVFIADLIKTATKSITLIDNYIDESVLHLFTKRKKTVNLTIYTKDISKILKQDLKKHNQQYPIIRIEKFTKAHDRFLIIDEHTIYHFGASLKDLGKKWFAFSKMDIHAIELLRNLKN